MLRLSYRSVFSDSRIFLTRTEREQMVRRMKKRSGRWEIGVQLFFFCFLAFPFLTPGSPYLPCLKLCCHETHKDLPACEKNEGVSCSSGSIPAEKNCREPSCPGDDSPLEKSPAPCPINACCQPSELPAYPGITIDHHPEEGSPRIFTGTAFAEATPIRKSNGIFSNPLQPFPDISKHPLYLKNSVLNV